MVKNGLQMLYVSLHCGIMGNVLEWDVPHWPLLRWRVFLHVCGLSHVPESLSLLKCSMRSRVKKKTAPCSPCRGRMWDEGARAGLQVYSTWVEALDRVVQTSPHSWVTAAARGDVWTDIPAQKTRETDETHRRVESHTSFRIAPKRILQKLSEHQIIQVQNHIATDNIQNSITMENRTSKLRKSPLVDEIWF